MAKSFVCGTCGKEHAGLPLDYAFGLPDAVFELSYLDRYTRSRSNSDFATLDDRRQFIRCTLAVPFVKSSEEFVWGLWVEVAKSDHDRYLAGFDDDLSAAPRFEARIANEIPGYQVSGEVVEVQFQSGNDRPALFFPSGSGNSLAAEQRDGISRERHHQILEAIRPAHS